MSCEWGKSGCVNLDKKCMLCVTDGLYYTPAAIRKPTGLQKTLKVKDTGRQGAISEVKAYQQFSNAIDIPSVQGTPNSGAGRIKGDMQVHGVVTAMIELKTTVAKNAKRASGKESFTIKREWLDKLKKESRAEGKEIFSLCFSFKELDDQFYAVMEMEHLMDIIATMKHDRLSVKDVNNQIDVHKKKAALFEAENTKLTAEVEYLKAIIKSMEKEVEL